MEKKEKVEMTRFLRDGAKGLSVTCAMILILEVVLRFAAFAWYHSEYYLYYGVHSWVGRVGINPRSTFEGGYYKFPPNYILKGAAGQGSETASINSHGFRGPDFETVKPIGVFRVVCLGESSTFGYRNRDDETYPYILERLFAQEKLPVQVINAGFPYYNTGSILSLLKDDIVREEPDLITLYAGYNDTSWPIHIGLLGRIALWLQDDSIIYLLLRNYINQHAFEIENRIVEKLIPQKLPREQLERDSELVADRYRENVRSIVRIAKSRGISIVLIKQPVTTHNPKYTSVTYEEENQIVREKFERGERLDFIEVWMLKHYRLMQELEKIAKEEKLAVVDNIKIVDQDRRRLASWVHLTGEGNLRLAQGLEAVIRPNVARVQTFNMTLKSLPSN
jgi:lysophospholipase L1-like esterase